MCRKIRNNFVIAFSYFSVIAIGILIYLVVFLFAEKRQNQNKYRANDFVVFPAQKSAESSVDSAKNGIDSAISIDELPNEIDSAINALEKPADSANVAESSAPLMTFPRDFIVDAKILNVRTSANTQAKIIKRFKQGAVISIRDIEGQWAKLANGGFAFAPLLKEVPQKAPVKTPAKMPAKAKTPAKVPAKAPAKKSKSAESSVDSAKNNKKSLDSAKSQNLPKNPTDSAPKSQNLPAKNPAK